MEEIWKNIKGYEGLYQISNLGKVKSLERKRYNGQNYYMQQEKILKLQNDKYGYKTIMLHKDKKSKNLKVHRLVAQAFLTNPQNKLEINHKDGNKSNNCVNNLEWCTSIENVRHAFSNNLIKQHNNTNIEQYSLDGTLLCTWNSISEAVNALHLRKSASSNISACCQHKKPTAFGYIWEYANDLTYRHHV